MEINDYLRNISIQLYAFSRTLVKEDGDAASIVVDAFQALILENNQLIIEYDGKDFSNATILRLLMSNIFRIASARFDDDLAPLAIIFLKHKGDFNLAEICDIVSLRKNELLAQLNLQRERMLSENGAGYTSLEDIVDDCRKTRNILSQHDLGVVIEKSNNHLQSCQKCQRSVAMMNTLLHKIDSLILYPSLDTKLRENILSQINNIVGKFQKYHSKDSAVKTVWINIYAFLNVLISRPMLYLYLFLGVTIIVAKLLF